MSDDAHKHKQSTFLVHAGRDPRAYYGVVNPPVVRTSTILYENLEAYFAPDTKYRYGRMGNPLSNAFEEALAAHEGGCGAVSMSSGLASITTTLLSFVKAGDHILMVDAIYPPARFFAQRQLTKLGVDVEFYDPCIGADIAKLVRENTALIYMESPCSATFEVQDVPAIVNAAKEKGVITILDNTWSGGVLFKPLEHGVDISVQSAAKYIGGHSDVNLGVAVAKSQEHLKKIKETAVDLGQCAGSEDLYLAMRGLRTIEMRFKHAQDNMRIVLNWFLGRAEVQEIFSPVLENAKGHDIWKRDFIGANGLFSVLFKPEFSREDICRFVNALTLFPVGSSWGGYESLIQPQDLRHYRTKWEKEGQILRFQIGNEDPQDLIDDLMRGMKILAR